jgi:membrane protein
MTGALPESPTDLTRRSWWYVARRTGREFSKDQCLDLAAALTYYAVLSLFPALLALLSLVGLVGQGPSTVRQLMDILRNMGGGTAADTIEPSITSLSQAGNAAGFALVLGLVLAVWSASGYVGAFGRALNRVYQVGEGRPFWKLRPLQLALTLAALVLIALVACALVLTGPAARAVGDALGLGDTAVLVWDIAKWPVVVVVVLVVISTLYYATPNVRQPKFRWISGGALVALVVWVLASTAFGFYVSNFASYNKTYGALAGVVVFLLWLWLTNLALLFGAELNAELERGRELQGGLPAEKELQLPPRDTKSIEKTEEKDQDEIERGRELREAHGKHAARQSPDAKEDVHAR